MLTQRDEEKRERDEEKREREKESECGRARHPRPFGSSFYGFSSPWACPM